MKFQRNCGLWRRGSSSNLNRRPRRKTQRDRNNLIEEKERQNESHRQIENELHALEVRERELQSTLKERKSLEKGLEQLQKDVASNNMLLKVRTHRRSEMIAF
jgi:hypothetical protein